MSLHQPIAAGKSSFDLVDAEALLTALDLMPGQVLLDLACGRGAYSLHLAQRLGPKLTIHALDLWQEGITQLQNDIKLLKITSIHPAVADASQPLPLARASIDVCLLATVLHDFKADGNHLAVLAQIQRVVKPGGRLAVLEFKVKDGPPGPPKGIRLGYQAVGNLLPPFGFIQREEKDMGPNLYLGSFVAAPT